MIDLKQLEDEIDAVLAKETEDSLLTWLYQKRISDMKKRLGEGVFESLIDCNLNYESFFEEVITPFIIIAEEQSTIVDDCNFCYGIAA